jgi:hypothetical protein
MMRTYLVVSIGLAVTALTFSASAKDGVARTRPARTKPKTTTTTSAEPTPETVERPPVQAAAPRVPRVRDPEPELPTAESAELEPEDGPPESGFSLGARLSYALPMGTIAKDPEIVAGKPDLSKTAAGMLPIWVEGGYRINRNFFIGGYFAFAPVFTSGEICKRPEIGTQACSSNGNNIRFGALFKYTFDSSSKFKPWLGVGFGYEVLNVSITVADQNTTDGTSRGFEFFSGHFGGDFRVGKAFSIGPAISFSVGQYASYSRSGPSIPNQGDSGDYKSTGLHQWFSLGVHGQYDL